jgi:thiol-disulfide isomerase/thioredoxin
MSRTSNLVCTVLLFTLVLSVALVMPTIASRGFIQDPSSPSTFPYTAGPLAANKEPAPRFTAKTMDGEKFNNDSVKGKIVLLEFWTTWCGFCANEAPFVDKINQDFADRGLVVLAVNLGESKKIVKKYLEEHPRNSKVVLMEDTNLAAMYVATAYPIYVVIDRDGNVAATQRGAAGEDALRHLLTKAGLDSEPSEPSTSAAAGR